MDGSNVPRPFVESSGVRFPTFSPGGEWLAYSSNETGRDEVYVRRYPDNGQASLPVSPNGGNAPTWSHDGNELFYYSSQADRLMSVGVTTQGGFRRTGVPRPLFELNGRTGPLRSYDVSMDGRFVVPSPPEIIPPQPVTRIHLVLNWFEELTRLAPGR